ncbi:MAG TPA: DUF488 domain-containing protein [Bryobacteraceae bacterium]|nr:DUF488 domain-containing protein [Bryobacteraceae bacterium]
MEPIFTVGHSTRSAEDFIALLKAHRVDLLVDVRTVPKSRHNPQFNLDTLPETLRHEGIDYLHLNELGGLRKARKDSTNTAWRNLSFRGYADYMEKPEFEKGILRLMELAETKRLAVMCAEAVPWRCHRSLISDALTARGAEVFELASPTKAQPHKMTPFARVEGTRVTYPWRDGQATLFGDWSAH